MPRPDRFFEWQTLVERDLTLAVGSRERLRVLWGLFLLGCVAIVGRAAQLEITEGDAFRQAAVQPGRQNEVLPAPRGRILARDGTVLAEDESVVNLAIPYRYLENPPDSVWLRGQARRRLSRADRAKPARVASESAVVCHERDELHRQLAERCGLSPDEWRRRAARIQRRVEAIAKHVNQARQDRLARDAALVNTANSSQSDGWWSAFVDLFTVEDARRAEPIIVAEQLAWHVMIEATPADLIREIRDKPDKFPSVRLSERLRRTYPTGSLAANIVGHIARKGPTSIDEQREQSAASTGQLGVERRFEEELKGRPGLRTHLTDHRGQWLAEQSCQPPTAGHDVVLSLDPGVQQAAESLLDRALESSSSSGVATQPPVSGAVIAMNIANGELLAAASAPRFDPNAYAHDDSEQVKALLASPERPLFDRATKMALPPGSVFKLITAVALLESQAISSGTAHVCRGYLHEPDHLRCAIYRHSGVGHGELRIGDALAQSCNVFFFHHAAEMGPGALVDWAARFGAGKRTGVDLPDEAAGRLGTPGSLPRIAGRVWQPGDTYALAIGQGPITATPLQVARWVAAIANGGRLVTPRVTCTAVNSAAVTDAPSTSAVNADEGSIVPIAPATLAAIREGMLRVVNEPEGTGYATVRLNWPTIAGKTGTAETGGNKPEHAWFAGYAPADDPKWAIVVVLEHGGNGATAAGPIARRMIQALCQAGYL